MDYNSAEQELTQLQRSSQESLEKMQGLAQKVKASAKDEMSGREMAMDLRDLAMQWQQQNQQALVLIQGLAQYVHTLEQQLQTHPQPTVQPRGWTQGVGGGGFLGSLVSGLGMGAGFGLAEDAVNDIFNQF